MKKILSLVLSACMMLSAAALAEGTFTPADSYDVGERVYNAGTVTLENERGVARRRFLPISMSAKLARTTPMKRCTPTTATLPALTSSLNWDPLSWET